MTPGNTQAAAHASKPLVEHLDPLTLALVVVAIVVVSAIGARIKAPDGQPIDRASFFRSAGWKFTQFMLCGLLLLAAAWHSMVGDTGPDAITVTFIVLVIVIAVAPIVDKIAFPGSGEIDFATGVREDVAQLTQSAQVARIATAEAGTAIAEAQTNLVLQLRNRMSAQDAADLIRRSLITTSANVAPLLCPPPPQTALPVTVQPVQGQQQAPQTITLPEHLRISAWIGEANGKSLFYVMGWSDVDMSSLKAQQIAVGDDPASRVFQTGQALNFDNLPAGQRPPSCQNPPLEFQGIMIVPIRSAGAVVGVLQIERQSQGRFEPGQVPLAKALAALYGTALLR